MAGGRELLDQESAKFIASFDVVNADEAGLIKIGLQVVAWQRQVLVAEFDRMKTDGGYADYLDCKFVGEGNGGVDARAIVQSGIEQCDEVLNAAYGEGRVDPLFDYAEAEMTRQAGIIEEMVALEKHAAGLQNLGWRLPRDLGIGKADAVKQWVLWFQVNWVNQAES